MRETKNAVIARKKFIIERSNRAVELTVQGKNHTEIAAIISGETRNPHYDRGCVIRDIDRALSLTIKRSSLNTDKMRLIEANRLDYYLNKLNIAISRGDTKAIEAATRIVDRKIRLLGLDQPIQVQIEQKVNHQLEVQFNLFFEAIANSAVIPDEYKETIVTIAANIADSAIVVKQD